MANDTQVTVIVKELGQFIEGLAKRLNLGIVADLVEVTPKDTGWAASNWVPSIGQPINATSGTREDAEKGNLDYAPQARGIADISTKYKLALGSIFISNNVDYILKLNDGSSRQAPRAFVERSIERAIISLGGKQ